MRNLIPVLFATLIAISFLLFRPVNVVQKDPYENENAENNIKKEWERRMFCDPATGVIPEDAAHNDRIFYSYVSHKKRRGNQWIQRGPWNVGGRTRTMAIDIKNEKHILAGSVSGGIWESTDGGDHWNKVSSPNAHPGVVSISQDKRPGKENIWYALSGEIYGTSASGHTNENGGAFYLGDGAFISTDNGKTWNPITSTSNAFPNSFTEIYQGGWRIASSPVDSVDACVYMAVYSGVLRSTDSGKTWKTVVGKNGAYFSDVAVSKKGIVFATLGDTDEDIGGFFMSRDGVQFTDITPSGLTWLRRSIIEINPNNENEIYFLAELNSENCTGGCGGVQSSNYQGDPEWVALWKYTYISGNGTGTGGKWENLSSNLPVASSDPFDKFNCQGGYDLCFRIQPGTQNAFLGGTNLFRSTDMFSSSQHIRQIGGYEIGTTLPFFGIYANHHPDQHDLCFLPSNPEIMYSVSDGGVRRTLNCTEETVKWENKSLGYITSQVYQLGIDPVHAGDHRMMVGLQDNGNFFSYSNYPEQIWNMPVNGDGAYEYISPKDNFYITSIQQGRIVKIELDEAGNLVRRRRIDPAGKSKSDYHFIHPFQVSPYDHNTLILPIGKKIYRLNHLDEIAVNNEYTQLSEKWIEFTDTIQGTNYASELEISSRSNVAYIGTGFRTVYRIENIKDVNSPLIPTSEVRLPNAWVHDIAIDPDDDNKVLICYANYNVQSLFYTENGGQDWFFVGGNLEKTNNSSGANPSIRSVAILKMPDGTKRYFAGTSIGLFSTDTLLPSLAISLDKNTWIQESPDQIGANVITDIKVRQTDGYVAVATHGNGVFETYYPATSVPQDPEIIVASTLFPNPATDHIFYSFPLEEDADVRIDVVDMMGRVIRRNEKPGHLHGTFYYRFDISSLQNGTYFLNVKSSNRKKPYVQRFQVFR